MIILIRHRGLTIRLNFQDRTVLLRRRAEWAKSLGEPRAAAEMFLSAGDIDRAISIIAEYGWIDMLIKVGRQLDKADRDNLSMIAKKLKQLGASHGAAEIFSRLGDDPDVADVLVDAQAWPEAFELAERNPKLKSRVYGPYARWLAETGRFSEAQEGNGSLLEWTHTMSRRFTFNIYHSVPNGGTTGGIDTRTHDAG